MSTTGLPAKGDRAMCKRCGLGGFPPIVTAAGCSNAAACAKRARATKKQSATPVKNAKPEKAKA